MLACIFEYSGSIFRIWKNVVFPMCVSGKWKGNDTRAGDSLFIYIYFETSHKNVIRLHEFSKESVPLSLPPYQLCMQVPAVYILCVLRKWPRGYLHFPWENKLKANKYSLSQDILYFTKTGWWCTQLQLVGK